MDFYTTLDSAISALAGALWGTPLVILLLGGGIFFAAYSRLTPILYFKHGIDILLGKFDSDDDPGQITHFEALSSALAGTVGMGNIAGVAVAIHTGGPGAVFWMWITAILGMSTKFFTCTLALMYRGKDDQGEVQGGVMYYIEEGLGPAYRPLAIMFSISGLLGCIVFFQAITDYLMHFSFSANNRLREIKKMFKNGVHANGSFLLWSPIIDASHRRFSLMNLEFAG